MVYEHTMKKLCIIIVIIKSVNSVRIWAKKSTVWVYVCLYIIKIQTKFDLKHRMPLNIAFTSIWMTCKHTPTQTQWMKYNRDRDRDVFKPPVKNFSLKNTFILVVYATLTGVCSLNVQTPLLFKSNFLVRSSQLNLLLFVTNYKNDCVLYKISQKSI